MSKTLVAYFSASGVTAGLARTLAEAAAADLYEIRPQAPYTRPDLDWTNKQSRSTIEMQDPASRPTLADKDAHVGEYDVVFLGFPIWWYVAPTIINTFLESYDFSGKTIVPFATSGSSGMGRTMEMLAPCVSGAEWKEGRLLSGRASKDELVKWIGSLKL